MSSAVLAPTAPRSMRQPHKYNGYKQGGYNNRKGNGKYQNPKWNNNNTDNVGDNNLLSVPTGHRPGRNNHKNRHRNNHRKSPVLIGETEAERMARQLEAEMAKLAETKELKKTLLELTKSNMLICPVCDDDNYGEHYYGSGHTSPTVGMMYNTDGTVGVAAVNGPGYSWERPALSFGTQVPSMRAPPCECRAMIDSHIDAIVRDPHALCRPADKPWTCPPPPPKPESGHPSRPVSSSSQSSRSSLSSSSSSSKKSTTGPYDPAVITNATARIKYFTDEIQKHQRTLDDLSDTIRLRQSPRPVRDLLDDYTYAAVSIAVSVFNRTMNSLIADLVTEREFRHWTAKDSRLEIKLEYSHVFNKIDKSMHDAAAEDFERILLDLERWKHVPWPSHFIDWIRQFKIRQRGGFENGDLVAAGSLICCDDDYFDYDGAGGSSCGGCDFCIISRDYAGELVQMAIHASLYWAP